MVSKRVSNALEATGVEDGSVVVVRGSEAEQGDDVTGGTPAEERSERERLEGELAGYRTYLAEMSEDLVRARELCSGW